MLFAAFWDKLGNAFIDAIPIILGLVGAYLDLRRRANNAAKEVKEVKTTLETNTTATATELKEIKKDAKEIKEDGKANQKIGEENQKIGMVNHTLLNSNMAVQLKVSAVALRRVAELTSNADDVAAAELAERSLHEHDAKQAKVDAATGTPPTPPPDIYHG